MPDLTHLERAEPLTRILEALQNDGGVIIDDFIDPAVADALVADFQGDLDGMGWGNAEEPGGEAVDAFFGYRTKRLHGLIGRSAAFEAVLTDDFALACAQGLLGDYAKDVILSTNELMAIGPEEIQQSFHRDADTWHHVPRPHPELLVSFNVALTDFTERNGATVVAPGSHRWGARAQAGPGGDDEGGHGEGRRAAVRR